MVYGYLTDDMRRVIERHVRGQDVWDLGAGDLTRACMMRDMGARVRAIDKEHLPEMPGIDVYVGTFLHFLRDLGDTRMDVACAFWPCNHRTMLGRLIERADKVLYLGRNSPKTGSACGGPGFWSTVVQREVLDVVEHRRNVLIVYGPNEDPERDMLQEEVDAYEQWFPGLLQFCRESAG